MSTKKAIPELSIDTQTIEQMLLGVLVGETVSYHTLSAAIGRDVQHGARHILNSARRRVLREHHAVFEPVTNEGMKRLDDAGKIGAGHWHMRRMRNQARYAMAKVSAVDDFPALPNTLKVEHNVLRAQSGVLLHLSSKRITAKLRGAIGSPQKEMPLRACLSAMEPFL